MNYLNNSDFDSDNLVNIETLEFKRDKHNDTHITGYTHNDEYFEAIVHDDLSVRLTHDEDTIFELESKVASKFDDFVKVYTERAERDLSAWIKTQSIPDFKNMPTVISNVSYIQEHPFYCELGIEYVVNDFETIGFMIDPETLELGSSNYNHGDFNYEIMAEAGVSEGEIERVRKIDNELRKFAENYVIMNPYNVADNFLTYKMESGVRLNNYDFSEMKKYDVAVTVEGETARLIVNRKDSFWEACLYLSDQKYAKMEQDETVKNGGFSHMNDDEFLSRVCLVYGFMKGIFIDLEDKQKAA